MQASKLTRPHEQVLGLLSGQIQEGEALLLHIPNLFSDRTPQDTAAEDKIDSWHRKNAILLKRLFTEPVEHLQYINVDVSPMDPSLEAVTGQKLLRLRLQNLRSLRDAIAVYDEATPTQLAPLHSALIDNLHPTILKRCTSLFNTAHYDEAMLNALKCVEEGLRSKINAGPAEVGQALVDKALNVAAPLLVMTEDVKSEKESAYFLFRGAIGLLKNPNSHRFLDIADPQVALEVLAFASFLLRKLDGAQLVTAR
jgi:uncharacterized protein (TIGR02391 family)